LTAVIDPDDVTPESLSEEEGAGASAASHIEDAAFRCETKK
jgi:hypothetical protein